MNINYNPIFIFPEFNLTKNVSVFFKILIGVQIAMIIIIILIFYPMEIIFLFNRLFGIYSLSQTEKNAVEEFKNLINNISNATLSCDGNNNLIINNSILALDINKNNIVCTAQIRTLYEIE